MHKKRLERKVIFTT